MIVIIAIVIIASCLNVFLWTRKPHDGEIVITTDYAGKKIFSLELDKTPEELEKMKRVAFKVVSLSQDLDDNVLQLGFDEVAD